VKVIKHRGIFSSKNGAVIVSKMTEEQRRRWMAWGCL